MPFCRNGQVILCTWTATTGFVPPPNVGPDGSSRRSYPASPHQYVVCGPDTRGQRQLGGRWDCHTLCPDIGAGVPGQWAEAAPPQMAARVASSSLVSWTLAPATTRLRGPPPPLPTGFACCPPCPGPWDWGQLRPPQASLPRAQSAACHSQSTPPSSSHSSTMTDHTWFNTPDSTHSRWIVLSSHQKSWADGSIGWT